MGPRKTHLGRTVVTMAVVFDFKALGPGSFPATRVQLPTMTFHNHHTGFLSYDQPESKSKVQSEAES